MSEANQSTDINRVLDDQLLYARFVELVASQGGAGRTFESSSGSDLLKHMYFRSSIVDGKFALAAPNLEVVEAFKQVKRRKSLYPKRSFASQRGWLRDGIMPGGGGGGV